MDKYFENIKKIFYRQMEKGVTKYGRPLELAADIDRDERLEMMEEELCDALMYLEHLKSDEHISFKEGKQFGVGIALDLMADVQSGKYTIDQAIDVMKLAKGE